MERREPKYAPSPTEGALRQGGILSDVVQVLPRLESIGTDRLEAEAIRHKLAIVLTQECDLEQCFRKLDGGTTGYTNVPLPSILLAEIVSLAMINGGVAASSKRPSRDWEIIAQNNNPRFHVCEQVPKEHDLTGVGVPAFGIDFKRYFTVSTLALYRSIAEGATSRRTCLLPLYASDLCNRFSYYQSRIALVQQHDVGRPV